MLLRVKRNKMAAQPTLDTDSMKQEKKSCYAFFSDMFDYKWIQIKVYTQLCIAANALLNTQLDLLDFSMIFQRHIAKSNSGCDTGTSVLFYSCIIESKLHQPCFLRWASLVHLQESHTSCQYYFLSTNIVLLS